MNKVKHSTFALSTSSNRIALLLGIHAGTVTAAELEQAVLMDTEARLQRKPVVAEGRRFDSVTDAAHWIYRVRPELRSVQAGTQGGEHAAINRLIKRISRYATADNREGYFWTE